MKYELDSKTTSVPTIRDLNPGDLFEYCNAVYIRSGQQLKPGYVDCVGLLSGSCIAIKDSSRVYRVVPKNPITFVRE